MAFYGLLADTILVTHVGFILFVIVGQALIVVGAVAKWAWVRNATFRFAHLGAIGFVVVQAWLGQDCPLTHWENNLRIKAGQEPYGDNGFIASWLHKFFFFEAEPWVFTLCYSLFGLLVLASLIFAKPRRRATPKITNQTPSP